MRSRRRGRAAHRLHTGITLTSLMDILTCLLFFVLKSFVAGGEATVPPPGLKLPRSTADANMHSSLVIAIDKEAILVGTERIASVQQAESSDQLLIQPLAERLQAAQQQMDELAKLKKSTKPEVRIVTIQGDGDIEFRVLQKVMYTLNQSGFEDISLAVLKKAEERSS
jgi:biopolymer transport protein ExbD